MKASLEIAPYFAHDGFVLYHADCAKALETLPGGSVDVIFADPPYNLSNGGFTCHSGRRAPVNKGEWDASRGFCDDFAFHLDWITRCRRVLKEDGTIWISGTYHSIYSCGYALLCAGYQILNDICWFKPNAPPNLSTRYFTASHETLLWAKKNSAEKHLFNYEEMKNGEWHRIDSLKQEGRQMRSVWKIPSTPPGEKSQGRHPTQKPLALLCRILKACTRPGDMVLDPFSGSSTTGLAAYMLKRKFIGIEQDLGYLDLSVRRFHEIDALRKQGRS
jgi:site-specific DNA-methyltransferase (adenine-specific)